MQLVGMKMHKVEFFKHKRVACLFCKADTKSTYLRNEFRISHVKTWHSKSLNVFVHSVAVKV